jgi:hypothetical protein
MNFFRIVAKTIENGRGERRGDLVSESKRMLGLFDLIKALRPRIEAGLKIPLQFQDRIFICC